MRPLWLYVAAVGIWLVPTLIVIGRGLLEEAHAQNQGSPRFTREEIERYN